MSETKKNEVQVWKPAEFAGSDLLPVAAGARQVDQTGRENIEAGDLILPSLKLLQGSSEEVKQGVEGARAGLFWLSGAEEPFKAPMRILACAYTKSRSLFPKEDRAEHQGLGECLSRDGKTGARYGDCASCPYKEWDNENDRRPACSESHNFTVLTPFGPAVLRFTGRSTKGARKLLTAWTTSEKALYSHPITITTKPVTDRINGRESTSYVMETKWDQRQDVPPHVQLAAHAVYEQVKIAHDAGKFGTADERAEGDT